MDTENQEADDTQTPEEVEREARNLGWSPKEQFKGPEDKWIPAEEFLEKGRHVVPILHQNNKRLQRELLTRDAKIGTLESQLAAATKAIEGIENRFSKITEQAVKDAKAGLIVKLQQAREDEDVNAEVAIQDQLTDLRNAELAAQQKKENPPEKKDEPNPNAGLSAEFVAWKEDNPWFGGTSKEDRQRTKEFLRMGEDLREEGATETGAEFYALVESQLNKSKRQSTTSKVESGNSRAGAKSGQSFADLPAEAKAACHSDIDVLVGEGKRYKTVADWEKAYTKIYLGDGN